MDFLKRLTEAVGENAVITDAPMAAYTTFRIGGPADYLVTPEGPEALGAGIALCRECGVPFYIIGNGSNLLVGDDGYRGVIFHLCKTMDSMHCETQGDTLTVTAGAGCMLSRVAKAVSGMGYTGFEFATGIPGTLGGGVAMNAGAYGGEMKDVLVSVKVMDREGSIYALDNARMDLGYRRSLVLDQGLIVLEAVLSFKAGDPAAIDARVEELAAQRKAKQPLEYPSAGSTFKRPPQEGMFAGKLIQDSGMKGYRVGDAQVSEKHAGFVINTGHATARDVTDLIAHVRACVRDRFGVELETEIRMIGSFR